MRRNRNRKIIKSWAERHPAAADALGIVILMALGYGLIVLGFAL